MMPVGVCVCVLGTWGSGGKVIVALCATLRLVGGRAAAVDKNNLFA